MPEAAVGALGPVSQYVVGQVRERLEQHRVVVWYDPAHDYTSLADARHFPGTSLVHVETSRLRGRQAADAAYRRIEDNESGGSTLLIYLPYARGRTPEQQQADPFESFVRIGTAFGDNEAHALRAVARSALPQRAVEIERLFESASPTLAMLDRLDEGARYPLVRQVFNAEGAVEVLAQALLMPDAAERLSRVPGALAELARLAEREVGLPVAPLADWPALRGRLAPFLVLGELSPDLPDGLPAALATVPHAAGPASQIATGILDRLRADEDGREVYSALAIDVEGSYLLADLLETATLRRRDTFRCQERLRLGAVVGAASAGDVERARALLEVADRSPWRRDAARAVLWRAVQRCLSFLEVAAEVESTPRPNDARGLIGAYSRSDGLWRLDREQRQVEQAAAECAHDEALDSLFQRCRQRYYALAEALQHQFQPIVVQTGWPPEDAHRQTQTFDSVVAPELAAARRVAYFLVDSLRYEMGRTLAEAIEALGEVTVEPAVSALPATTPFGMAALLPGADGALRALERNGEIVPALGDTPLPAIQERKALLAGRFGDRCVDLRLEDVLEKPERRLSPQLATAHLVVVRTQDIDELGEGTSLYRAREAMSRVIGQLKTAATRLAKIGFQTLVFAADHGHILLPEIPAGGVVAAPPGEWLNRKRRSLVGRSHGSAPGVLVVRADHLGIIGFSGEIAFAEGLKTFSAGTGYFHEGLSLQECIVPIVVLHTRAQTATGGAPSRSVVLSRRNNRFTTDIVNVSATYEAGMFDVEPVSIQVEVFDGPSARAVRVGQTADCEARDPATGEVLLPPRTPTTVSVAIDPDYRGEQVEVRAIDARTGAILARLNLQNARLD